MNSLQIKFTDLKLLEDYINWRYHFDPKVVIITCSWHNPWSITMQPHHRKHNGIKLKRKTLFPYHFYYGTHCNEPYCVIRYLSVFLSRLKGLVYLFCLANKYWVLNNCIQGKKILYVSCRITCTSTKKRGYYESISLKDILMG